MKKSITRLFSVFMVILFICSLATIIQAAPTATQGETTYTAEQDGLSLSVTTDKVEYSVGQDITVTVTLQNNNDVSVYYRRNSIFANNAVPTSITYDDENNFIDMSYYGENPTIQDYELVAGETITQTIRFKSGYTEESYIGYFDETKPFIQAPTGSYLGRSVFEYSFEEGENTATLSKDFAVVIKSVTDDPLINYKSYSEENGLSLTASTVKPIYAHGEKIEFNVSIKNSNDFSVDASNTEVTLYNLDTQTEYDFDILEQIYTTDTEIKSDEILEWLFTKENNNNPLPEGEYLAIVTVKYSIESENMSDKIWANSYFKISDTLAENVYSTTQDDLELTIALPKTEYLEGEDIIIDCSLKNNDSVPVYQAYSLGTAWYGAAKAVNKETKETYYFSKNLPQVNHNATLMSGERFNWKETAYFHNFAEDRLPAGEYTLTVYSEYGFEVPPERPEDMDSSDNAYTIEVSADFTVLPLPTYTAEQDGVELTVTFDKAEYNIGDTIKAEVVLKNNSEESIYFHRDGAFKPLYMDIMYDDNGNYFNGSESLITPEPIETIGEIKPGEESSKVFSFTTEYSSGMTGGEYNFTACEAGEYIGKVWAAYSLTEAEYGVHENDIELAIDFTVTVVDVNPEPVEADLAVSAVATSSATPEESEDITLNATVRNYGEEAYSGDVTVDFYKNGVLITTVTQSVELASNGYVVITADEATKFAFGSQTVYADITCDNTHNDTDSANNIIKKRVVVE